MHAVEGQQLSFLKRLSLSGVVPTVIPDRSIVIRTSLRLAVRAIRLPAREIGAAALQDFDHRPAFDTGRDMRGTELAAAGI